MAEAFENDFYALSCREKFFFIFFLVTFNFTIETCGVPGILPLEQHSFVFVKALGLSLFLVTVAKL